LKLTTRGILGSQEQNAVTMNGNVLAGIAVPTFAQNTLSNYYYYYYYYYYY